MIKSLREKYETEVIGLPTGATGTSGPMATPISVYAIGDCGAAMHAKSQVSRMQTEPKFGGMSHALAAGNVHAPEMDGSRHAACMVGSS